MQTGLSYNEAMDMPFAQLMNYIAIEQYKNGARLKEVKSNEAEFDELLEFK